MTNSIQKTAWMVDYIDNAGKRRQKTFKLKKEADAFVTKLSNELSQSSHVPASESITVAQACSLWPNRTRREGLECSTHNDYEQVSHLHDISLIGNIKFNELLKCRIERFRDELLETRSHKRACRALLNSKLTLDEAKRLGKVEVNVAENVKIKERDRYEEDVTILSKQELAAF